MINNHDEYGKDCYVSLNEYCILLGDLAVNTLLICPIKFRPAEDHESGGGFEECQLQWFHQQS